MKEILRASERVFTSIPEDFRDTVTVRFAEYLLQAGPDHGLKTGKGRAWAHKMFNHFLEGKEVSLSRFTKEMFDGFNINMEGLDNLPTGKGLIIAVNETSMGPLKGNWVRGVVNLGVAESRNWQGNYEARWVQKSNSNNALIEQTPFKIQKRRLAKMISQSCNTILIDSNASNTRPIIQMKNHLQNNGVVVICPEGEHRKSLGRGVSEAGDLLLFLSNKFDASLIPAAAWNDRNNLNLKFGEIVNNRDIFCSNGQQMADLALTKIAQLLPEDRRGVYA